MQAAGRARAAVHEPLGDWSPSPDLGGSCGQHHATRHDMNLNLILDSEPPRSERIPPGPLTKPNYRTNCAASLVRSRSGAGMTPRANVTITPITSAADVRK